jgi:hypothetical protein
MLNCCCRRLSVNQVSAYYRGGVPSIKWRTRHGQDGLFLWRHAQDIWTVAVNMGTMLVNVS